MPTGHRYLIISCITSFSLNLMDERAAHHS